MQGMTQITSILAAAQEGDAQAGQELLPLVYDELRRLAAAKMAREAPGQTLQPTELVHETCLRLGGAHPTQWKRASCPAADGWALWGLT